MPSQARALPKAVADGRYEITKWLGEGSFGAVYAGIDNRTQGRVAIKFEESSTSAPGSLKNEAYILDQLRRPYQRHGFVEVFFFSKDGPWSVMVMEELGKSLEDCVESCAGKLDIGTTASVGEQVVHRLEYLHSKCIVHRDIKPENFMFGIGRKVHHLYIIDFGLSVKYWDRRHAGMSSSNSLTGTARYASVNAHRGCTQSRRDDLEATAHMFMYFLRGSLPWSGLKAKTQAEKFKKIADTKESFPLAELCQGFPPQFEQFLSQTRKLQFKERPDYKGFVAAFREVRKQMDHMEDWQLQWLKGEADLDVKTLLPMEPGLHQQPDDLHGRGSIKGAGGGGIFKGWGFGGRSKPPKSNAKDKE